MLFILNFKPIDVYTPGVCNAFLASMRTIGLGGSYGFNGCINSKQ
jgi:hypothetical protein